MYYAPLTGINLVIVAILSAGVVFCVAEVDAEWEIEWPFLEAEDSITVPCGVNYTGQCNTSTATGNSHTGILSKTYVHLTPRNLKHPCFGLLSVNYTGVVKFSSLQDTYSHSITCTMKSTKVENPWRILHAFLCTMPMRVPKNWPHLTF